MQAVTFNTQKALADGYTPQQIQQYMSTRQQQGVNLIDQSQQQSQPQQPQQPKSNGLLDFLPLLGSVAGSFTPLGPIAGGAAGGALGQEGENLLTGQGNISDVVKQAALGGAGGLLGKVTAPLFNIGGKILGDLLPKGLDKSGTGFIASQYNVPRTAARALKLNQTIDELGKYGISNINDIIPAAEQVTGANGVVTKLTRKAIAGASPVDTNGLSSIVDSLMANPAINDNQATKFTKFINKGIGELYGGTKGSLATTANPEETYTFIQQLEKQANQLNRLSPFQKTASDIALKNAYNSVADELKQRLFQGSGADNVLTQGLLTPIQAAQLATIHPQLATDIGNAQTIGELRSIAAPFVRGSQLAQETGAGSQIGFNNVGGATKGVGKLFQNPLNMLAVPMGSNAVNASVGTAAKSAAQGIRNIAAKGMPSGSGFAGRTIAQSAVRLPDAINQAQSPLSADSFTPPTSIMQQPTDQATIDSSPQANLRKMLALSILSRARSSGDINTAVNLLLPPATQKPLSSQEQNMKNLALSGSRGLNEAMKLYQQDPTIVYKQLIPGHFLSRKYDSAMFSAVESLLRARSGAAVPEAEVRRYMSSYAPQIGDTTDTIQYKFDQLNQMFNDLYKGAQNTIPNQQAPILPAQ